MSKEKELEEYTRTLQEQIMEQAKEVYTETVLKHCQNPQRLSCRRDTPAGFG